MLSQVVELIEAKRRFAITSHIRPDGDSLGSSLGLYWLLRALDKDAEVIMRDPVPHAYQQLPGANEVREGFECGISLENFNDVKVGDQIEAYIVERVAATEL